MVVQTQTERERERISQMSARGGSRREKKYDNKKHEWKREREEKKITFQLRRNKLTNDDDSSCRSGNVNNFSFTVSRSL